MKYLPILLLLSGVYSRVLVDAVVGPGLAGDVGLGPGSPASVAVRGVHHTLPYIICEAAKEVNRKLTR